MPDLIEYDIDKAKDILNVYGLNIANKSEAYSNTIPKGEIISQYPAKATEITTDQKISLVVSKGALNQTEDKMPEGPWDSI
ncbi:PASTA domain-containing protein [uncultured Clostridium sp.]|uniref:PASTA domain-containing protein n=1 Tax=uncultured Clostridium sp. TaxID=59620 RepID=UPI0025D3AA48|nr:PASTA domain-containing protein [uncultured Clostridium sp.]